MRKYTCTNVKILQGKNIFKGLKDKEKLRKSHNSEETKERHGNSIQCEPLDQKKSTFLKKLVKSK